MPVASQPEVLLIKTPLSHATLIREAGRGTGPAGMPAGEGIRRQTAHSAKKFLHLPDSDGRFVRETAL